MIKIPENYTDFLYWVKERTESFWSNESGSDGDFTCEKWVRGAKWIGLQEAEIDRIEENYSIKFTPEHREFLAILHTIDRREEIEHADPPQIQYRPFFYNWLEDGLEIKERFDWPRETILEDVLGGNQVWLNSWGIEPESDVEKTKIVSQWINKAPKLIPIMSHRFSVSDLSLVDRPILSVWGSDIIVYGWNFRHYLLKELKEHLNLVENVYDEDNKTTYVESVKELKAINEFEFHNSKQKDLPFWREMILYWSSGWSSFGLEYPHRDHSEFRPIIKADISDDAIVKQKRFTPF